MLKTPMRALALVALPASLALAACNADPSETPATAQTDRDTVAQAVASAANLSTLSRAITDAQLAEVLDGSGSYTLFAPSDDAFAALGENGQRLLEVEQRPLLVGLLREHIVPGHITPDAIGTAIDEEGGSVSMTTMGGGSLTFSRNGDAITVSRDGNGMARFAGQTIEADNGVVIPIDAALVPEGATSTSSQSANESTATQ